MFAIFQDQHCLQDRVVPQDKVPTSHVLVQLFCGVFAFGQKLKFGLVCHCDIEARIPLSTQQPPH
jgi:hypothetical protein